MQTTESILRSETGRIGEKSGGNGRLRERELAREERGCERKESANFDDEASSSEFFFIFAAASHSSPRFLPSLSSRALSFLSRTSQRQKRRTSSNHIYKNPSMSPSLEAPLLERQQQEQQQQVKERVEFFFLDRPKPRKAVVASSSK